MDYKRTEKSGIRKFPLLDVVAESKMEFGGLLLMEQMVHRSNLGHPLHRVTSRGLCWLEGLGRVGGRVALGRG